MGEEIEYDNSSDIVGRTVVMLSHTIMSGQLDVWGIPDHAPTGKVHMRIPLQYWADYDIATTTCVNENEKGAQTVNRKVSEDPMTYHDLRVDRTDVLRIWPRATNSEKRALKKRERERQQRQQI
jgi:hypothetical protein